MVRTVQRADADVFTAIAHPVRRQLLDRLAEGEHSVHELAAPFTLSRPAISQHLRVLLEVQLVSEQRAGRERIYRLEPTRLADVGAWLDRYQRFWRGRLRALGTYLEEHP